MCRHTPWAGPNDTALCFMRYCCNCILWIRNFSGFFLHPDLHTMTLDSLQTTFFLSVLDVFAVCRWSFSVACLQHSSPKCAITGIFSWYYQLINCCCSLNSIFFIAKMCQFSGGFTPRPPQCAGRALGTPGRNSLKMSRYLILEVKTSSFTVKMSTFYPKIHTHKICTLCTHAEYTVRIP